jgi:DNA-binding transcriptional ArsR family regulator
VLRALANPDRLLITLWLAQSSCSVRKLEEVTGLSQSLVSHHLADLRKAGLVSATAQGRTNRYTLSHPDLDRAREPRREPGGRARAGTMTAGWFTGRSLDESAGAAETMNACHQLMLM